MRPRRAATYRMSICCLCRRAALRHSDVLAVTGGWMVPTGLKAVDCSARQQFPPNGGWRVARRGFSAFAFGHTLDSTHRLVVPTRAVIRPPRLNASCRPRGPSPSLMRGGMRAAPAGDLFVLTLLPGLCNAKDPVQHRFTCVRWLRMISRKLSRTLPSNTPDGPTTTAASRSADTGAGVSDR